MISARPVVSTGRSLAALAGFLALSFVTGATGAIASRDAQAFYAQLTQPSWAPPPWLFGPVWTVLYVLMAVGAWLVWRQRGWAGARGALTLFLAQLAFNALWTWLFFAWRMGAVAFAEILVMWVLIAATLAGFWRIRPAAGALLVPYLAWVTFAAALNFTLWRANPAVLG